jgi:hypothetical protein
MGAPAISGAQPIDHHMMAKWMDAATSTAVARFYRTVMGIEAMVARAPTSMLRRPSM